MMSEEVEQKCVEENNILLAEIKELKHQIKGKERQIQANKKVISYIRHSKPKPRKHEQKQTD